MDDAFSSASGRPSRRPSRGPWFVSATTRRVSKRARSTASRLPAPAARAPHGWRVRDSGWSKISSRAQIFKRSASCRRRLIVNRRFKPDDRNQKPARRTASKLRVDRCEEIH